MKEIIEEDNQEKQNVHRLIISSSELREREYLTTKSYLWKQKTSYNICEKKHLTTYLWKKYLTFMETDEIVYNKFIIFKK